jgi:hypothetical protein
MADEPPEFLCGLPILFFYEDPDEKRMRVTIAWPRTFAPERSSAALGATSPKLGGLAWALRRTGERDDLFAALSDPDEGVRAGAAPDIGKTASGDARTVPTRSADSSTTPAR